MMQRKEDKNSSFSPCNIEVTSRVTQVTQSDFTIMQFVTNVSFLSSLLLCHLCRVWLVEQVTDEFSVREDW